MLFDLQAMPFGVGSEELQPLAQSHIAENGMNKNSGL